MNTHDDPPAVAEPRFDVVADHGFDAFPTLANDPIVTPFVVQLGNETRSSIEMPLRELLERLDSGGVHPSTSQPAPETYAERFRAAARPVLGITVSSALSGSLNAADQGRALAPGVDVMLHDSGTVSAAESFQVHAAMTARARGHDLATAVEWMRQVHAETELFFTLGTLVYLQRGGRIGRVMATLGTVLDLKPIITVDKKAGAYTTVARARTWGRAIAREVAPLYALGLVVLTLLLLASFLLGVLADVLARGVPAATVASFLLLKLPAAAAAGLPLALLFAALLALTRLTQDGELRAALHLGLAPRATVAPVLAVGAVVAGLTALNNEVVVPWSEARALEVQREILLRSPETVLQSGAFFQDAACSRASRSSPLGAPRVRGS